jgi:hypothetical protein
MTAARMVLLGLLAATGVAWAAQSAARWRAVAGHSPHRWEQR